MRPAELRLAGVILQVGAETVAAQDTLEHGSQQAGQDCAAARGRHRIDHVPRRHKGPQEAFGAVGPPTRLIDVQHRLIFQLLFQFLARCGHRLAGFFPALLRASQTDVDSQNLPQQGFHHPARHAADHRQVGDQRRQLRPEMPLGFLWHRRARAFAALRTDHAMTLIFDRARLDGRQFGHLMPLRFPGGLHLFDVRGQRMTAVPALFRQNRPNLVDLRDGQQGPMRPAMAGLSAHFSAALLAAAALARFAGQSVGGRRLGRVRRVLLAQRQLTLQIGDLLFGVGDLLLLFGYLICLLADLLFPVSQLAAKPFVLPLQIARLRIAMPRIHPPYGSRFGAICPAQSPRGPELLQEMTPTPSRV